MSALLLDLRVLVVDDNRDAADSLTDLLRLHGAEVRVCYDAAAALDGTFAPDAAVLDIHMPQIDGLELARRLRAQMPERILLVALTGVSDEVARRKTAEAGFDLHLTKGIATDVILAPLAAFARLLREQHQQRVG